MNPWEVGLDVSEYLTASRCCASRGRRMDVLSVANVAGVDIHWNDVAKDVATLNRIPPNFVGQ